MISRTVWTANSDGTLTETAVLDSTMIAIKEVGWTFAKPAVFPFVLIFTSSATNHWDATHLMLKVGFGSTLALFAQRTRIPTSARSIGFCAIWVCISSSSSSNTLPKTKKDKYTAVTEAHKECT